MNGAIQLATGPDYTTITQPILDALGSGVALAAYATVLTAGVAVGVGVKLGPRLWRYIWKFIPSG